MNKHKTSDGIAILNAITGKDAVMLTLIEEEAAKLRMARAIYELRTKAGLSQTDLTKRIGATQSVISRIEDADYEAYSLEMLQRIAKAVNKGIEIRFVPLQPSIRQAGKNGKTLALA
jgi:ribosome-binding protein aMBF1 (putative translation factor)